MMLRLYSCEFWFTDIVQVHSNNRATTVFSSFVLEKFDLILSTPAAESYRNILIEETVSIILLSFVSYTYYPVFY